MGKGVVASAGPADNGTAAIVIGPVAIAATVIAAEDDKQRDDDKPYALVVENIAKAVIHSNLHSAAKASAQIGMKADGRRRFCNKFVVYCFRGKTHYNARRGES